MLLICSIRCMAGADLERGRCVMFEPPFLSQLIRVQVKSGPLEGSLGHSQASTAPVARTRSMQLDLGVRSSWGLHETNGPTMFRNPNVPGL